MSAIKDQHFLTDSATAERMLSVVDVQGRRVLEIGPGLGVLTRGLLERGAVVIAVEIDPHLCMVLEENFALEISDGRLELVRGDATKCSLPPFDLVVANLPYSVSSTITFRLLRIGFDTAVLMYQKEFAERMIARPGTTNCGRLSIMAQTFADIEPCFEISPRAFRPMPRVRSMVLKIIPRPPPYPIHDIKIYEAVVRTLFSHRRKTVKNGLRSLTGYFGRDLMDAIISDLPGDLLRVRPEELSLSSFAEIANVFHDGKSASLSN